MKYYIITQRDGHLYFLRRYRINKNGYIVPTMITTNINKAKSFDTLKKVQDIFNKLGIGYAIFKS